MNIINFKLSQNLLTIYDVANVLKKDALQLIKNLRAEHPEYPLFIRKDNNIYNEFCTHKWFYILGIKRERTKDADMQYPLSFREKIGYPILGLIARIFIK